MDSEMEMAVQKLEYLYCRWQDEGQYEDFGEYKKAMAASLPAGATMTRMAKRPFMVEFTLADGRRKWIKAAGGAVSWGSYRQEGIPK